MVFENRFQNQVAIVTGGGSGIGLGIGSRIAREGGTVILVDMNKDTLSQAPSTIGDVTGHVETLQADVTAEAEMLDMAQAVVDQFQRVDMVVNSAGIIGPTSTTIPDYSLDDFRRVLDVNLMGSFNVTKYAIKAMQPQGYGRILLLASIAGKEGNPGMVGYATSKAGVIGLVKSVAKEYADTQITVNGLAPALIATPMLDDATEAQLDYLKSKIPMGRLGTIDEIAALSCWIISKESSFTTGAIFDISGGRATY